jgi:hypothetical protein
MQTEWLEQPQQVGRGPSASKRARHAKPSTWGIQPSRYRLRRAIQRGAAVNKLICIAYSEPFSNLPIAAAASVSALLVRLA